MAHGRPANALVTVRPAHVAPSKVLKNGYVWRRKPFVLIQSRETVVKEPIDKTVAHKLHGQHGFKGIATYNRKVGIATPSVKHKG